MNKSNTAATAAPTWLDPASIIICTLAWGTTWFAITLQFGVVDTIVSIVYRFALAASLLFAWCALRRETFALTAAQHRYALGVGFFNFAINYAFVYAAETRVTSAVVAVVCAAMAFVNQMTFRLWLHHPIPRSALAASALGILGVGVISWEEIVVAQTGREGWIGIGLALTSIVGASFGNVFAHKSQLAGTRVVPLTAWSMTYGAAALTLFAIATGRAWSFDWSWTYVLSLLHLSIVGSVLAFVLYYGLAQRRGYTLASYISALTPLIAMAVSSVFEHKHWGPHAFVGAGLVLAGQYILFLGVPAWRGLKR